MRGVELTDRESTILRSIIDGYVREAKPVSSSAVVRLSAVSLSSATVRNVMRALEEKGLILQPHTSAGRIPTDLGYRYYVDNLVKPIGLTLSERTAIGSELVKLVHCDLATVLAGISHMVSEASRQMAVAVAPSGGGHVIEQVALAAIGAGRIMVVVATDIGPTRTAVLTTDGTFHRAEVSRACDLLNNWLRGVTLSEATATVERQLLEQDPAPGDWLAGLLDGVRIFLSPGGGERIHYEGARYIFRHPEFSTDAASLGDIFDSEETLADVVRGSAEAAEVRVVIGGENVCRGMRRMSLVAGTYRIGGSVARMGIIGPTRMRYPRLIGLVGYFSKVLDDLLAE